MLHGMQRPLVRRVRRHRAALAAGGAAVLLLAFTGLAVWSRRDDRSPAAATADLQLAVDAAVAEALEQAGRAPPAAALVYEVIRPSLVAVRTDAAAAGEARGIGGGVIVNREGAILTALHVVDGAAALEVTYADGTVAAATIASRDPDHDIAVLHTDVGPEVIVPAVLGGAAGVGDDVFAVGHPLGLLSSLSAGVVSAVERTIPVDERRTMEGLIQFDAAVNPGNSGGPLLNEAGQVIGIVTALANPSQQGFFVGVGFAVPIGLATTAAGGPSQ
jgi:S1-C subfamily serine protease